MRLQSGKKNTTKEKGEQEGKQRNAEPSVALGLEIAAAAVAAAAAADFLVLAFRSAALSRFRSV